LLGPQSKKLSYSRVQLTLFLVRGQLRSFLEAERAAGQRPAKQSNQERQGNEEFLQAESVAHWVLVVVPLKGRKKRFRDDADDHFREVRSSHTRGERTRSTRKTCSNKCRQKAYNRKVTVTENVAKNGHKNATVSTVHYALNSSLIKACAKLYIPDGAIVAAPGRCKQRSGDKCSTPYAPLPHRWEEPI
jgi:hypothetical protein